MILYRCTMEKYSTENKRWVYSDLENFNRDKLYESILELQKKGWFFKPRSWKELFATQNQIATAEYIGAL